MPTPQQILEEIANGNKDIVSIAKKYKKSEKTIELQIRRLSARELLRRENKSKAFVRDTFVSTKFGRQFLEFQILEKWKNNKAKPENIDSLGLADLV